MAWQFICLTIEYKEFYYAAVYAAINGFPAEKNPSAFISIWVMFSALKGKLL